MDISVIRHARPAADRALSIAAKAWRWLFRQRWALPWLWEWLTKPSNAYPQPPRPTDENARGIGWSGHERVKPFAPPPKPPGTQLDHVTVHENINPHPLARPH